MVCIYCGSSTRTVNSRQQRRSTGTWRRRQCTTCGNVFTTLERADLGGTHIVIKRSGLREPFDTAKLLISLFRALEHRSQPGRDAYTLHNTILGRLFPCGAILESEQIAHVTMETLSNFDASAAIKYRSFQSTLSNKRDVRRIVS